MITINTVYHDTYMFEKTAVNLSDDLSLGSIKNSNKNKLMAKCACESPIKKK